MKLLILSITTSLLLAVRCLLVQGWTTRSTRTTISTRSPSHHLHGLGRGVGLHRDTRRVRLYANDNDNNKNINNIQDDDDTDDNTDNDTDDNNNPLKQWIQPEDTRIILSSETTATPKLGIDLGAMLEPLSEAEAADLKAAATEVINDAIAEGIDEIEKVRERMRREFERKRQSMALQSEANVQRESAKLLNKIDALTDAFLASNEATRSATKLAAAADRSVEGKGVEIGAWGSIGGAVVATGSSSSSSALLGSVSRAQQQQQQQRQQKASSTTASLAADTQEEQQQKVIPQQNKILILADTSQDPYAKKLIPKLTDQLQQALPGIIVDVYKPTAMLPIGGDNAACALLFCTSLSDKTAVNNALDRLLRKTLQAGGAVGQPPTQLVVVSTLGTERTNKMPYSMQNLMSGGKLDKRRQMEEAVINAVRNRVTEPALDYTICKLGELKDVVKETVFDLEPGDVLDGTTTVDSAAKILLQAIAFQPAARNATLSVVGDLASLPNINQENNDGLDVLLDDAFLKLDGPELWRTADDLASSKAAATESFDQLVEYMVEWAMLFADSGKGLTTPIRAQLADLSRTTLPSGISKAAAVQILFLPTATGKNYLSRAEEKVREQKGPGSGKAAPPPVRKAAKEGGVEIRVEVTDSGVLRIRAKRCNYATDAVVKEISEETILGRLKDSIKVWQKDHKQ